MKKMLFSIIQRFVSTVRCKVCGGWGGEYGIFQGVGSMCSDCYAKGGKL